MTLRTKKSRAAQGTDLPNIRHSQRVKLPHNSIFILGPQTNREWLHGVRADKRPAHEKTDEEKAFGGERISITFRQIGTFMNTNNRTIWGSGAKSKLRDKANKIPFRDGPQMEAMINAFGKENHDTDFDWEAEYGDGFDVVNLINTKAKLIRCNDWIANIRVQLALYAKSIAFDTTKRKSPPQAEPEEFRSRFHTWMHGLSNSENPIFQDIDDEATETEGDLAILFHLENLYPFGEQDSHSQPDRSTYISHIAQANELLFAWREIRDSQQHGRNSPPTHRFTLERPVTPNQTLIEDFHGNLKTWEKRAENTEFIAGGSWTIIDCAFWPVLHHVIESFDELSEERYPNLMHYYRRVLERESVKASLAHEIED